MLVRLLQCLHLYQESVKPDLPLQSTSKSATGRYTKIKDHLSASRFCTISSTSISESFRKLCLLFGRQWSSVTHLGRGRIPTEPIGGKDLDPNWDNMPMLASLLHRFTPRDVASSSECFRALTSFYLCRANKLSQPLTNTRGYSQTFTEDLTEGWCGAGQEEWVHRSPYYIEKIAVLIRLSYSGGTQWN